MTRRTLTLANGLRCYLHHAPAAREAAALVQVGAGSLQEPDRWPGLAHLLEHLLFCDSAAFSGEQRLMPWVQQQGGEVNATTQLSRSAWFFQLPASVLAAGVERLADMLILPQLTPDAIRQECAVIDAEYRLLQHHTDTLSEAALLHQLAGRFRRFRVGSNAAFGDSVTKIERALRQFHQRYFIAANMQLWLAGPHSLDELAQLAQAFDGVLAVNAAEQKQNTYSQETVHPIAAVAWPLWADDAPESVVPADSATVSHAIASETAAPSAYHVSQPLSGDRAPETAAESESGKALRPEPYKVALKTSQPSSDTHPRLVPDSRPLAAADIMLLELPGNATFWLALLLPVTTAVCDSVTLMRHYWLDEATGGLLYQLRLEALCETAEVSWLWQGDQQGLLVLRFSAAHISAEQAGRIELRVWQHLRAVTQSSSLQHQHYLQLAQCEFRTQPLLCQLRQRAGADAPSSELPQQLTAALHQLSKARKFRVLTCSQLDDASLCITQGFTLRCRSQTLYDKSGAGSAIHWCFPPRAGNVKVTVPDVAASLLPQTQPVEATETLLLRPAFYHQLSPCRAAACLRLLRPLLAELRHLGGGGRWQQQQGNWQLLLEIPASHSAAWQLLPEIAAVLEGNEIDTALPVSSAVAIRQLLQALPSQLRQPAGSAGWLAAWCGSDHRQNQLAASTLHRLIAQKKALTPPALMHGITPLACQSSDQALLLFIPLSDQDNCALAALQALALFIAPRFFQRLRVEQQIGYVVSARYERCADVDGLLFALQSPDISWQQLLEHCKRFLHEMRLVLRQLSNEAVMAWQQTLLTRCQPQNNAQAAEDLLRREKGLPVITPESVAALTLPCLQQLLDELVRQRRRWRLLINQH